MIAITKAESQKVRSMYPDAGIVRTSIQKTKRPHYYLTEYEPYLRMIVDSNASAAEICQRIDRNRERKRRNRK